MVGGQFVFERYFVWVLSLVFLYYNAYINGSTTPSKTIVGTYITRNDDRVYLTEFKLLDLETNAFPNTKTFGESLSDYQSVTEVYYFTITPPNGYSEKVTNEMANYVIECGYCYGKVNKGEERILVDSINVKNFADYPEMRAREITLDAINAIKSKEYDFVLINLSNPDMIGHTGDLDAAMKAIKVVDECAYEIAMATLEVGGEAIVTADHGNAETMIDEKGDVVTSHTTNPVPLWLVSERYKDVKLMDGGKLANIAPTVLKMLEIEKPETMINPLF